MAGFNSQCRLELQHGLIQLVQAHQHDAQVHMRKRVAGIELQHLGIFADGVIHLVAGRQFAGELEAGFPIFRP